MILMISGIVIAAVVVTIVAWVFIRKRTPPTGQQTSPVIQEPGPPRPPAG
jgi:flagellar basal body-associated protein FliL